ncbi:RsmB/NOP family class I SAM-dependent RNA methyltransferase [Beijerinckia indica]|uniref:Sun protein n=1 Tax=Beijerinckia indica subsp. indica (strain ATCC 9039 / DSM 1715 / NCIMB 8712) TaxID=395963 RepID=B2IFV3_BEII9|nr:transcription antitermination factor NusB [Beijerinckia indica]ACB95692.1 sun protein [Beijerinckia indica subsp. indica ATCC 9039]
MANSSIRPAASGRSKLRKPAASSTEEQPAGLGVRRTAAAILRAIVTKGQALDDFFAPESNPEILAGLEPRDKALARSIVTVALRRLGTIRAALTGLLAQGLPRQAPDLEWILLVAGAQILFLDVPDHAAVDLAVRATRLDPKSTPFAPLVNAVLRNLARGREKILAESDALAMDTPAWLAKRWRETYGEELARAIALAHREEPTLDVTVLAEPDLWAEKLGARLLPTGSLRLETHAPIADLPGFAEGVWFVQDAAAALPARLMPAGPGLRIADFCAAPGGKAAQLAATGAHVTAIDRSATRLKRLSANFARLHLEAEVLAADVLTFEAEPFDGILLDAPCSATGTIRRHPDIAWIKQPKDILALALAQARMLDKAATLLKAGGTLIYCTCSLEPEEGEERIEAFLQNHPEFRRRPISPGEVGNLSEIINQNGDLRILPAHFQGTEARFSGLDGFFVSRLVRCG